MNKEKLKISLIIFFGFLIPLISIYFIDAATDVKILSDIKTEKISSFDSDKTKVVLIGSSTLFPLDAEYMDQYISINGKKVDVYNHALSAESPSNRLSVLEKSISEQPDIVFIGVDAGKFFDSVESETSSQNLQSKFYGCSKKLPEVQDLYSMVPIKKRIFGLDFGNFDNPKFSTLKLISEFTKSYKSEDISEPIMNIQAENDVSNLKIQNYVELEKILHGNNFEKYLDLDNGWIEFSSSASLVSKDSASYRNDSHSIKFVGLSDGKQTAWRNNSMSLDMTGKFFGLIGKIENKNNLFVLNVQVSSDKFENFRTFPIDHAVMNDDETWFYAILPWENGIDSGNGVIRNNIQNMQLKIIAKYSGNVTAWIDEVFILSEEITLTSNLLKNNQNSSKTSPTSPKFNDQLPADMKVTLTSLTDKQSYGFHLKSYRVMLDEETIKKKIEELGFNERYSSRFNPNGFQANALKEIIQRLQNNNIKVAIFSTPLHNQLYQIASPCGISDFESFLENLSKEFEISHYNFHDRYLGDYIWRDHTHIVHGEKGLSYSKAVAEAIQKEV